MRELGNGIRRGRRDTLDALTDTDVAAMYTSGVLGRESPDALLRTLWRDNVVFMGMKTNPEHHKLKWGDIVLKQDPDLNDFEYLELNTERGTKMRNRKEPCNIRELPTRAWCLPDNPERCPVTTYKFYRDRRPENFMAPDTPYYLAVLRTQPRCNSDWFKCQAAGKGKVASFMQTMVEKTSFINKKPKLTNTPVREHQVAKLNDTFVPVAMYENKLQTAVNERTKEQSFSNTDMDDLPDSVDQCLDNQVNSDFEDYLFSGSDQEENCVSSINWDSSLDSESENTCTDNMCEANMPSSRFVDITGEKSSLLNVQENKNTARKTKSNVRLFQEFLKHKGVEKRMEEIPASELCAHMETFILSVRKKNFDNYQPSTLEAMVQSIFRYLKEKKYTKNEQSDEFSGLRGVLRAKKKVRNLTS